MKPPKNHPWRRETDRDKKLAALRLAARYRGRVKDYKTDMKDPIYAEALKERQEKYKTQPKNKRPL